MLPSKPKSGLSPQSLASKGSKLVRAGSTGSARLSSSSPAPLPSSRTSPKRGPERRSTKPAPVSDKQSRAPTQQEDLKKAKEQLLSLQQEKAQALEELTAAKKLAAEANEKLEAARTEPIAIQENLNSAKEQLLSVEQEKVRAVDELNATKKLADEANEKLEAALAAQKQAEELSAAANARADESDRARAELENVKVLHASAADALRAARQELALQSARADDNAGKVKLLNVEVERLKSKNGAGDIIKRLGLEIDALRQELETAKAVEDKLVVMEMLVERLGAEADDAKRAELDSRTENSSLRQKVEQLETKISEANKSEESSIKTLSSLMKQVEEASLLLQEAENTVAAYKTKTELLETELAEAKRAEVDASKRADEWKTKANAFEAELTELRQLEMSKTESLASVSKVLSEKNALLEESESERLSLRTKIETLESESQNLATELEKVQEEEDKAKKAMEGLASALHEVSVEAREAQQQLFEKRVETEDLSTQISQLKSDLKNTEENYEVMLDEARYEIVCLKKSLEKFTDTEPVSVSEEKMIDTESVANENIEKEYDMLPNHDNAHIEEEEEEPVEVEVEVKMLEGYKESENSNIDDEEVLDDDLDLNTMSSMSGSFDQTKSGTLSDAAEDGYLSPVKQSMKKEKKPLFKFGSLLKKKNKS